MDDNQEVADAFEGVMAMYESKAFTELDRSQASPGAMRDFRALLRKRLLDGRPLPAVAEVEGIKELVLDFFHVTPGRPPSPYGKGQF